MSELVVSDLTKEYGGIVAVDEVSFEMGDSDVVGLIGPNGAGKTTLFNLISGFVRSDQGEITFDGQSVSPLEPHERAQAGLVRTFQDPQFFPELTVLENLLVAGEPANNETVLATFFERFRSVDEEELREEALDLLRTVHLYELRNEYADQLSGGQEKLLELGKVLMLEPRIVMLDEPSAGDHPDLTDQIIEVLRDIVAETDIQFFVIEHNVPFVDELSDDIMVMSNGRIIARGPLERLKDDEQVLEAYLG